jgi:hypothetical protein
MDVVLYGGPLDGETASVWVDDPDPGTALPSARCSFEGGRCLYEPDGSGRWVWVGDTP